MSNSSELFEFLPFMTNDERSLSRTWSFSQRMIFEVVLSFSFTWGTFIKFFIYYHILREKFSERPINALILIDQVADHFIKTVYYIYLFPKVSLGMGFATFLKLFGFNNLNDRNVCTGVSFFSYFMIAHGISGGLGIALTRALMVTTTYFEGPFLMWMASIGSLALPTILSLMKGTGSVTRSSTFNGCLGHTANFEEVFLMYNNVDIIEETWGMKLFNPINLLMQFTELICYIYLFSFLAKHDKEMEENRIITLEIFNKRKRTNLFSLKAQIFGCALEISYHLITSLLRFLGGYFFPRQSFYIRGYVDLFFISQFSTTATLQILVSPGMRKRFFELFKR